MRMVRKHHLLFILLCIRVTLFYNFGNIFSIQKLYLTRHVCTTPELSVPVTPSKIVLLFILVESNIFIYYYYY